MRRTIRLLGFASICLGGCSASTPAPAPVLAPIPVLVPESKAEAWVFVRTEKGSWEVRIDGGPTKQVASPFPMRKEEADWVSVPGLRFFGQRIDDGKRVLYSDDDPLTQGKGKTYDDLRKRILVADKDGKNPKQIVTGLMQNQGFLVSPDGKAVYYSADRGGKWDVYRVAFDGSEPVKVSRTSGIAPTGFRVLSGGQILYQPILSWHVANVQFGTFTSGKGPVILTDGKAETVLLPETNGGLPEMTDDATKMAVSKKDADGEEVVEITDLKTGTKEQFPLQAFHKDWTCRFETLKFSPDGRCLAVTFYLGNVVIRNKGPLPGDEAVQHFGAIWLDGRKNRTALFRVDQPLADNGYFPEIKALEWSARTDDAK